MMKHKGYVGESWVDHDAEVIRGRVIGVRDVITFQGETPGAARAAFVASVDDYLAFCAERGEPPEKPYSGKILLRLDPTLHRALSMTAERSGLSLNSVVVGQLKRACLDASVEGPVVIPRPKKPVGMKSVRPQGANATKPKPEPAK